MKKVIILGSTGSLGQQTLEVLTKYQDKLGVIALTARSREKLLAEQAAKFKVPTTSLSPDIDLGEADIVINLLSGIAGIEPTKTALKLGKTLLLGNKESIVAAGDEIMPLVGAGQLIPVDSEHNAIAEILKAESGPVRRLIIPCSGGPFLGKSAAEIANLTAKEALAHPKWSMGPKISVESATLINKGLEIIEAHYLFSLPFDQIEARIHPECLIHGAVEFDNGRILAYKSQPDMREHIENSILQALGEDVSPHPAISEISAEELAALPLPDHKTLPGIRLVTEAFEQGRIKAFLAQEEEEISKFIEGGTSLSSLLGALSLC